MDWIRLCVILEVLEKLKLEMGSFKNGKLAFGADLGTGSSTKMFSAGMGVQFMKKPLSSHSYMVLCDSYMVL